MLKLTFDCSIQLLMASHFQFRDKLNNLTTYLCFYALLMYCLVFYALVYRFTSQSESSNILAKSNCRLQGFLYEGVAFVGRNFIRAFVHGFFIGDHPTQMILLAGLDILFCVLVVRMWAVYEYRIVAGLSLAYYLVLLIFDLFFAIK